MSKNILSSFSLLLLFLTIHSVFAQNKETNPPKVARFITVGFKPDNLTNNRARLYEFELGYEQFITQKTSIIGGISYGTGNIYVRDIISGEVLRQYKQRRYSMYSGLRTRLLTKGKFSLLGELQAGFRREVIPTERSPTKNLGFIGFGIGAEYRFSDRIKGTLGINSQYSSTIGLETTLNPGIQIRLGRKE